MREPKEEWYQTVYNIDAGDTIILQYHIPDVLNPSSDSVQYILDTHTRYRGSRDAWKEFDIYVEGN